MSTLNKTLNAWIKFHLFVVIAKDIVRFNVGAFVRSDDRKSKKYLLPGKICLCFCGSKKYRNNNISVKIAAISNVLKQSKICV